MKKLASLTWTEVETYLKTQNSILIPIGSTEQHGPTGLLGTDFLTANAVAEGTSAETGILVAPPVPYGVAPHHMAFPGSVAIRPSIYMAYLGEIFKSYYRHGFRRFYVVNGHGGNEHSCRALFQELKSDGFEGASFHFYNWWKLPEVHALAMELYGDGEGFHATPSEVSLTLHLENLGPRPFKKVDRDHKAPWPMTANETRTVFPDGTMASDPGMSTPEDGAQFLKVAVRQLTQLIKSAAVFS